MATLQKIRNRGGLLVGVIFFALFAFVLGDAFRSGAFGNDEQMVGEIDGNEISYIDFQKKVDEVTEVHKASSGRLQLDDQAMMQVRNEVWGSYEFDMIFEPICTKLGLAVTSNELFDMVQGSNIHPMIQQLFADPQTGQFNRTAVLNFLRAVNNGQVNSQQQLWWKYLEGQIKRDRLATKYNTLVGKGLYVTTLEAKNSLQEKNTVVNFNYVKLPYSTIADSTINVSKSEIKDYYNAHKEEYAREAARSISYVVLPITATEADEKETLAWIQSIHDEFATTNDNQQFVNINSDLSFDGNYEKKEDVADDVREFAFSAKPGEVLGPIKRGNAYVLVKVDERKQLPDSVEARHILINPQTLGSLDAAKHLADSLKNLLETKKASFTELATAYSADKNSAAKGGDLGWFKRNQMVKPFEEAAFNGEVNKIYSVTSQFGIHLIQPTNKGQTVEQVRLAELVRNIEPSAHTEDAVYAKASKLAILSDTDAYENEVKELGLNTRRATLSEDEMEVTGLEDSRSLVRAAFRAENTSDFLVDYEGTSIFKFGENFVLAHLTGIQEKGYSPVDEVSPSITREVAKTKKAEQLASKMSGTELNSIASSNGASIESAENVNFSMYMVPTLGVEPAVLGTAAKLSQGTMSKAIAGNTGVYVLKNTSVTGATEAAETELRAEQNQLSTNYAYRLNYQSFEVIKEKVEIADYRVKFF